MQQQTTSRAADETICFRCGMTVKRDVGTCGNCGSTIAASLPRAVAELVQPGAAVRQSELVDEAGVGRYVLNFFLAGLIGLGLTYFMRRQGWNATWISAGIFVLIVAAYVALH